MPFDWKAFVDVARVMAKQAPGTANPDAFLRTALSRAYFGAYCHARNYAADFLHFKPREDADDHGRLRAYLKGKRRHADGDRLDLLRQWRNQADYRNDLSSLDLQVTVTNALKLAHAVITSLAPPQTTG